MNFMKFFLKSFILCSLIVIFGEAIRKPVRIVPDNLALQSELNKNETKNYFELIYEYIYNPNQETINLAYKIFVGQFVYFLLNILNGVMKVCWNYIIRICFV
jgi:hypothetical protein